MLWLKRRTLGKAALIGLVAAAIISILIPNRYDSTVQLMPPDSSGSSGMAMIASLVGKAGIGGALGGGLAGDLLGSKSTGALFVGVLESRTVANRMIDTFNLRKVYWRKTYYDARKKLASLTDIEEDKKSGLISITVSDTHPKRAAAMAQAYADELDRLVAEVTTSSAHRERVFWNSGCKRCTTCCRKTRDNSASIRASTPPSI